MEPWRISDRVERVVTLIGKAAYAAAQLGIVITELTRIRW
jgi:hypothetical protein